MSDLECLCQRVRDDKRKEHEGLDERHTNVERTVQERSCAGVTRDALVHCACCHTLTERATEDSKAHREASTKADIASATALTDIVVREIDRDALTAETERLSPWVLAMLEGVVGRFVDRSERLIELMRSDDD